MTDYLVLRLRARHAALEEDIAREHRAPLPDAVRLAELKKEKLQVRDKLHWILRGDEKEALRARA
ncbi:MAG: YdcH family protein [Alphaproteobacteria bacterium]|nr:YdcH family protein [Alphaproteobacteria bacterium]